VIALIYAHPHPDRSVAGRALLEAVRDLPQLNLRSLYDLYPDFSIDVAAERELLVRSRLIVWQHPIYWYTAPSLLKLWFEAVLGRGWAYGRGGEALRGKDCLWVTTTGAPIDGYTSGGAHAHEFAAFEPVVRQTAQFCGMRWLEPLVIHGAHLDPDELARGAAQYRALLDEYVGSHSSVHPSPPAPLPQGERGEGQRGVRREV